MLNILWNHIYSWGQIFVDCQNFAGSWGHNYVGNWFVALQDMTIHYFVKRSWGHNSWVVLTNKIHEHQSPMNNDDSTVNPLKLIYANIISIV